MKKNLLFVALLLCAVGVKAQVNIQEMYDFNRGHFTTTLEMFKADKWGSTFFFNDIYHPNDVIPDGYYTEISRSINFWKGTALAPLSLHAEWNGGQYATNSWLFGIEYFLHSADYRNTLTLELMYKEIRGIATDYTPLQFTVVWGMQDLLGIDGLSFSGFLDIWGESNTWVVPPTTGGYPLVIAKNSKDDPFATPSVETTDWVLLAEPQLWYNIGRHFGCPNLNIGGEVEIAYNFTGGYHPFDSYYENKGLTVAPCLGVKWNF